MWDPTPWVIGGGAKHSPEVLRAFAFAATGGGEGVVTANDLKVNPLNVAGQGIRVATGSAVILNRNSGGAGQSYTARMTSEDTVTGVPGTGSGQTRSDLYIAKIEDPQYAGTTVPADPTTAQYVFTRRIPGVNPATKTASELNLGYPAIALARVDYPASTSSITSAMLVDLRKLARPRRTSQVFSFQPAGDQTMGNDWSWWPQLEPTFDVPIWATHCVAQMVAYGVLKPRGGHVIGDLRPEFCVPGNAGTPMGASVYEASANTTDEQRIVVATAGEINCVSSQGQTRSIRCGGLRNNVFSDSTGYIQAVAKSNIVFNVAFEERIL